MKAGALVASKYRLIARLGQGGMGAVWSAANVQTGKEFAIKFLHPLVASSSEDARQRFLQEARASARMNHPNIIDIFDVGETEDGSLFLVMELLDGLSLQDAMRADPPFSARELIAIAKGCATALGVAHAAGIVHRDVKPPNIFLCRERGGALVRPKLLDFGVSKVSVGDDGIATHTGSLLGSPRYMAPEQAVSASQADGRADLWSLGVILYEGLTGVFPHDGDSSNAIVIAIAMRPPKPITEVAPFLPQAVRELVDDCLKPVASRVQSATILADRLQLILDSHDLSDVPLARPAHAKKVVARPDNFVIQTADSSSGLGV
ncbi:MAG: serine/threonine protein kinase, partial [Myxococcales bacterium]|nr:serine/threonine protein kinase [Myxococcales bacterium]